ncbi:MAG: DUF2848 family protein, partial [Rhodobacteraceae bacterium]|nr:DUF2848 family protein [Paracoccaceae bacterium]MCB2139915.1 DUF2848 family protein [Paracoccaceae bacterium]
MPVGWCPPGGRDADGPHRRGPAASVDRARSGRHNPRPVTKGPAMPAQVVFDADFTTREGSRRDRVTVHKVIVGGWTGRDRDALQHHIDELAKIG